MASRPARRGPAAAAPVATDAAAMERLTEELLPALVARLEASTLGELEIRRGDWRIRLRRGEAPSVAAAGTPRGTGTAPTRPRAAALAAVGPGLPTPSADSRVMAISPAVGYFAPLPALAAGAVVRAGDVLGHVDVLGVRQAVVAPADGVLARYLAESGEAVEYGQELVRLEAAPHAAHGATVGTDHA